MNIISIEDFQAARLAKRAAGYLMDVVREPAGTWSLIAHGFKTPELSGATLAAIAADLDEMDRQSREPNEDYILG